MRTKAARIPANSSHKCAVTELMRKFDTDCH
jgi:hypothetical protein